MWTKHVARLLGILNCDMSGLLFYFLLFLINRLNMFGSQLGSVATHPSRLGRAFFQLFKSPIIDIMPLLLFREKNQPCVKCKKPLHLWVKKDFLGMAIIICVLRSFSALSAQFVLSEHSLCIIYWLQIFKRENNSLVVYLSDGVLSTIYPRMFKKAATSFLTINTPLCGVGFIIFLCSTSITVYGVNKIKTTFLLRMNVVTTCVFSEFCHIF